MGGWMMISGLGTFGPVWMSMVLRIGEGEKTNAALTCWEPRISSVLWHVTLMPLDSLWLGVFSQFHFDGVEWRGLAGGHLLGRASCSWDRAGVRGGRNYLTWRHRQLQRECMHSAGTQQLFSWLCRGASCSPTNCPATDMGHGMSSWGTRQLWTFQWREECIYLGRNYPRVFPQRRDPPEDRVGTTVSALP